MYSAARLDLSGFFQEYFLLVIMFRVVFPHFNDTRVIEYGQRYPQAELFGGRRQKRDVSIVKSISQVNGCKAEIRRNELCNIRCDEGIWMKTTGAAVKNPKNSGVVFMEIGTPTPFDVSCLIQCSAADGPAADYWRDTSKCICYHDAPPERVYEPVGNADYYRYTKCRDISCQDNVCQNNAACVASDRFQLGYQCQCQSQYEGLHCEIERNIGGGYCKVDVIRGQLCNRRCGTNQLMYRYRDSSISLEPYRREKWPWTADCLEECTKSVDCSGVVFFRGDMIYYMGRSMLDKKNPFRDDDVKFCHFYRDGSISAKIVQQSAVDAYVKVVCTEIDCERDKPCFNGATCIRNPRDVNGYSCICAKGWDGVNCEYRCVSNALIGCEHGECTRRPSTPPSSYVCVCNDGYIGDKCQWREICATYKPCQNGASCENKQGGYLCQCSAGYYGTNCENYDSCQVRKPCKNGGTCKNSGKTYTCACVTGYEGKDCTDLNGCKANNPCAKGSTCLPTDNAGNYLCKCLDGTGGKDCQVSWYDKLRPIYTKFSRYFIVKSGFDQLQDYLGSRIPDDLKKSMCDMPWWCQNSGQCISDLSLPMGFRCRCQERGSGYFCQNDCPGVIWYPNYYKAMKAGTIVPLATNMASCQNVCRKEPTCQAITYISGDDEHVKCIMHSTYAQLEDHPTGVFSPLVRCTDYELSACERKPCQHNGICKKDRSDPYGYNCSCFPGYDGHDCEHIDRCLYEPCVNGATCKRSPTMSSDFECICSAGYSGSACQDLVACVSGPCQHGGTCSMSPTNPLDFRCACPYGFDGNRCENDWMTIIANEFRSFSKPNGPYIDQWRALMAFGRAKNEEVRAHLCLVEPCMNKGTCIAAVDSPLGIKCRCPTGFRGPICEYDMKKHACRVRPCLNEGVCTLSNNDVGFTCKCRPGFYGDQCQTLDVCHHHPCFNGGTCSVSNSASVGYQCTCPARYSGDSCETSVIQQIIDQARSSSILKFGSLDLSQNIDIICAGVQCQNFGTCTIDIDRPMAWACRCAVGFDGDLCERRTLCTSKPCQNGGTCSSDPQNQQFTCNCPVRFIGSTCHLENPCLVNQCMNGGTCKPNVDADKLLSPASICQCVDGYVGEKCETIKPCMSSPCQNGGSCFRSLATSDDYICSCVSDFAGKSCENLKVCLSRPCINGGSCSVDPIDRRKYTCQCRARFTGRNCDVIKQDEILFCDSSPCKNGATCDDGAKQCQCSKNYYGKFCENKLACASQPCLNGATCLFSAKNPLVFTCQCAQGFQGKFCENEQVNTERDDHQQQ